MKNYSVLKKVNDEFVVDKTCVGIYEALNHITLHGYIISSQHGDGESYLVTKKDDDFNFWKIK